MKPRKYMIVALVLIAIVAISIYLYRDSIARKVANSILSDSDLAVTGLSINSIGADNVYFDELVLEWSSGAQIRITGVVLPTGVREAQSDLLEIDAIELIPAGSNDQPPPIAAILASILQLPQDVPYPAVRISRVTTDGLPALTDVSWESTDAGQLLHLDIGPFAVAAGIEPVTADEYRLSITATTPDQVVAIALALAVQREQSGFAISGQSTTRMSPLLPVLQAVGMIPVAITSLDALFWGEINTSISDNPTDRIRIEATLQTDGETSLKYQIDDQLPIQIRLLTHTPTVTVVEFPSLDWHAQVESGELTVSIAPNQDFPFSLQALSCQAGIICTLQANIVASDMALGEFQIAATDIRAPMTITINEQTQINFAESMTAKFRGVSNSKMTIGSADLSQFSGATIDIDSSGWHGTSEEARVQFEGISTLFGLSGSMTMTLANMAASNSAETLSGEYHIATAATQLTLADLKWSVPDIAGTWAIYNNELSVTSVASSANESVVGKMEITHRLNSGDGSMHLFDTSIDFAARSLANFASPAPKHWDISAGRLSLSADVDWSAAGDYGISGSMQLGIDNVAAYYGDIALTGLSTEIRTIINSRDSYTFVPATLSLDILDVGLPIRDISARYQVGTDPMSVQIDALSMGILGGTVRTDPFNYASDTTHSSTVLRLESIQLSLMKALAEFDSIDIEGSISGVLPVTINRDHIIIDQGRLESDAPGGSIRYLAGDTGSDESQLGLATRALSNFEFTTLTSEVSYSESGDLLLAMKMAGVNPTMDPNQPVVLNLNLENNIPEMLRSLQATRSIQEIFEKRLEK